MQPADYARIEKAILYLEKNFRRQPGLGEVARTAGLSEYHFHRLFTRWAGISPKRFLQFLTAEYARRLLRESPNVLDAAYEAGLSGPGTPPRSHRQHLRRDAGRTEGGGRGPHDPIWSALEPLRRVHRGGHGARDLRIVVPVRRPRR